MTIFFSILFFLVCLGQTLISSWIKEKLQGSFLQEAESLGEGRKIWNKIMIKYFTLYDSESDRVE